MKTYTVEIDAFGTEQWFNENGERHRDGDKPAVICANGKKAWFKDGQLHRDDDKPAVVHPDGTREWWKNDNLHRDEDKPAVIRVDGSKEWWKNGIRYFPEQIDDCDGKIVEIEGKRYRLIAE